MRRCNAAAPDESSHHFTLLFGVKLPAGPHGPGPPASLSLKGPNPSSPRERCPIAICHAANPPALHLISFASRGAAPFAAYRIIGHPPAPSCPLSHPFLSLFYPYWIPLAVVHVIRSYSQLSHNIPNTKSHTDNNKRYFLFTNLSQTKERSFTSYLLSLQIRIHSHHITSIWDHKFGSTTRSLR